MLATDFLAGGNCQQHTLMHVGSALLFAYLYLSCFRWLIRAV